MAAGKTFAPDFIVSRDELNSLDKALKDEKFRTMLTEFVDEINDPEKKRLHEDEVKKLEKEKGVEVEFILPRAGFVLEVRETAGKDKKAKRTVVNLCCCDKVAPPSCEPVINGESRGLNWVIPHTISPARTEVLNCGISPAKDAVIIYDVVFHPDTVHLAVRNIRLRKLLIDTALDAVNKNHSREIEFEDIGQVREGEYFGKEFSCTVKRIVDAEKYRKWKQGELSLDKNGSESTGISQVSQGIQSKEPESDITVQETGELSAPTYRIKYQTNMDIQDFCVPMMGVGVSTRPTALVVEVDLPGVQRATEVDVDICPQFLNLRTPKHRLDLKLPYPVDEDSSSAKFDLATSMLTLNLTVIPNNNSQKPIPVHSQLSDSGIECESGYRTSSDGDNSSDVSCSSLEERLVEEVELTDETLLHSVSNGNDASNLGEEKKSDELVSKVHSYLQPPFTIAQGNNTLNINIKCHNVVPGSVTVHAVDEKNLQISYTNIGSGRTPLNYGLHVVMPKAYNSEVRHKLSEEDAVLVVEVEKLTAEEWDSCVVNGKPATIALPSRLYTASEEITLATFPHQVHELAEEEATFEEKEAILQQHTAEAHVKGRDDKDLQKPSSPKEISQVIPSVAAVRAAFVKARTVSECVDVPYNDSSSDNRRGPTGSWPRGILKRRPRSLSESHVGCLGSVGSSFGSYSSSFDFEGMEDEVLEKGEEEDEEGNESSSPGSKKTVRFSEVVSKQLFRSNSSILGQRAKNQRKALKKRRAQERKVSESDQENTEGKKSDDEEEDEGVGAEEDLTVAVQEMKEIDLEGDIFDSTTCEEETTDTDNNNSLSDNNSKNNINNKDLASNKKKNKKKGKKNKNKIKSLELSNAMIFELDIEP